MDTKMLNGKKRKEIEEKIEIITDEVLSRYTLESDEGTTIRYVVEEEEEVLVEDDSTMGDMLIELRKTNKLLTTLGSLVREMILPGVELDDEFDEMMSYSHVFPKTVVKPPCGHALCTLTHQGKFVRNYISAENMPCINKLYPIVVDQIVPPFDDPPMYSKEIVQAAVDNPDIKAYTDYADPTFFCDGYPFCTIIEKCLYLAQQKGVIIRIGEKYCIEKYKKAAPADISTGEEPKETV